MMLMGWQQNTKQPGTENGLATTNHSQTQPAKQVLVYFTLPLLHCFHGEKLIALRFIEKIRYEIRERR